MNNFAGRRLGFGLGIFLCIYKFSGVMANAQKRYAYVAHLLQGPTNTLRTDLARLRHGAYHTCSSLFLTTLGRTFSGLVYYVALTCIKRASK